MLFDVKTLSIFMLVCSPADPSLDSLLLVMGSGVSYQIDILIKPFLYHTLPTQRLTFSTLLSPGVIGIDPTPILNHKISLMLSLMLLMICMYKYDDDDNDIFSYLEPNSVLLVYLFLDPDNALTRQHRNVHFLSLKKIHFIFLFPVAYLVTSKALLEPSTIMTGRSTRNSPRDMSRS